MVNQLPDVGRIQGLVYQDKGTYQTSRVVVQYTDRNIALHQVDMPFLDAMYLLQRLREIQKQADFPMPDP